MRCSSRRGARGRPTPRLEGVRLHVPFSTSRRRRRRGSRGASCRWPAPALRPRSPVESVIPCSLSSICLVIAWAKAGPLARRAATRAARRNSVRDDAVDEADAEGLLRVDHVAEKSSSLARPSPTTRGRRYAAPMSAPQTHAREDETELGLLARDAEVARERDDGPRTDGRAVHRRDDGPPNLADVLDERPCDAREGEHALHVPREELADDVLHVAARAERSAFARDHDGAHVLLVVERRERGGQLLVDGERQRVEAVGPVEDDLGHAARHRVPKGLRG